MSWSVIAAGDVTPQRWKNDGGWTRELLAWPNAADWTLRISVADIERDGLFSSFPGVQRWFGVLSGAGVRLWDYQLGPSEELFSFDGALAPDCELLKGPTRDFNLMHRRALGKLTVEAAASRTIAGGDWVGLFTVEGGELDHGGRVTKLAPLSLAWCEKPAAQALAFKGQGAAWWMVWNEA
ncbi:HutD family protein [Pelomonas sp. SE-A7]|uniref:HutD/Ves family protein n=1 Tax=Pelomonas sp. SE-A7 TaxID=3054953 RepID=UPI00259CC66F|nr:HutD family protein [Pelomonas sp. SE-A7]MDM4766009.1 HutD family protein [Pelomonas sp. SE-A7]